LKNHALILCRSVTQAQRVSRGLIAGGIPNRIFRSPVGLTEKGCSYSVSLAANRLDSALLILKNLHISPLKIFLRSSDGNYQEVDGK